MRAALPPETGLLKASVQGLCPHCGARTLFAAPAQIAHRCRACGQDFAALERGGRLAGLLTILVAGLLIAAAIAVEEYLRPPIWLQACVWAPLTISAVLGALRLFKTGSVYRSYLLAQETEI